MTTAPASPRLTLRQSLGRTHMMISLTAVCMAGLFLTITALLALRLYADHNLELVARAISYTSEAAVVFDDEEAAKDALETITSREDIASASIVLPDGQVLASWRRAITTPWTTLEQHLARLILPGPVEVAMVRESREIARVHLVGHGQYLLHFLLQTLLATLVRLLLSILGALHVARRMQRSITAPLKALAEVAYSVSRQRALKQRVPAANIAELHALGEDFNTLLDELEAWQAHQKRENASLLHRATHDALTGLPNRALFEARLGQAIQGDQERFALLYLDCDRFKQINDTLGHGVGDEVLIALARRVQHQLRPLDLVCRLGGDEFVILLAPIRDEHEVHEVMTRIQQGMSTPVVLSDGRHLGVGISIGAALYPEQGETAEALLQFADDAMYQAKRQRKEEEAHRRTT
ncbi:MULTISPECIES: diguanylate cyclase domain-containing protein [Aeromonas]|uniref:Diguanylate cyclase n=1 Tax=Aeromonas caviae TaxID=648 RepID=A0A3N9ZAB8_AERCA|nr:MULTISPECIES: diguanylate cyclase [Aeromonas]MBP6792657.1 diguanylate cyclase [Aeromonas sp.]PZQ96253.1 MAG: GGDEF domain-containing protein [Aeromonas media]AUZ81443.1 diguanylate cyclase [Aeromonas sp. ASNIH1]AXB08292.1 diguanylate cyclase [Aeromonas caviae]MBL0438934.1 diguanylate cyclase [Aeromonas caviae]